MRWPRNCAAPTVWPSRGSDGLTIEARPARRAVARSRCEFGSRGANNLATEVTEITEGKWHTYFTLCDLRLLWPRLKTRDIWTLVQYRARKQAVAIALIRLPTRAVLFS